MRRFGIIIIEITENEPRAGTILPLRRHREEEILRCTLPEEDFDLKAVMKAILQSRDI